MAPADMTHARKTTFAIPGRQGPSHFDTDLANTITSSAGDLGAVVFQHLIKYFWFWGHFRIVSTPERSNFLIVGCDLHDSNCRRKWDQLSQSVMRNIELKKKLLVRIFKHFITTILIRSKNYAQLEVILPRQLIKKIMNWSSELSRI